MITGGHLAVELRNFTSRKIYLYNEAESDYLVILPHVEPGYEKITTSFRPIQAEVQDEYTDTVVYDVYHGNLTGLPDPVQGVLYIVSLPVALACKHRTDVVVMHDLVRNKDGKVIGCKAFARYRGL